MQERRAILATMILASTSMLALGCASSGGAESGRDAGGARSTEDASSDDDASEPPWRIAEDVDSDGDGFTAGIDCDDGSPSVNPGSAEDCNGTDDDCDGEIDEVAVRGCTDACGGGSSRCESGSWTRCGGEMPVPETCDGSDQDCDGLVDEHVSRTCSRGCGAGVETCSAGVFGECDAPTPSPETCNGVDDDCDGSTDEGLSAACVDLCGNPGTQTCVDGGLSRCAVTGMVERCNGVDDDCDSVVDEGCCPAGMSMRQNARGDWACISARLGPHTRSEAVAACAAMDACLVSPLVAGHPQCGSFHDQNGWMCWFEMHPGLWDEGVGLAGSPHSLGCSDSVSPTPPGTCGSCDGEMACRMWYFCGRHHAPSSRCLTDI